MTYDNFTQSCGSGWCGSCPTPCFVDADYDPSAFDALVERGPEDYDDLADAQLDSDAEALQCLRWDDPEAACEPDVCASNFFCFEDYQGAPETF
ncbi:hypothetical protein AB0G06_43735 [Nonomuraea dietziae]|uniref:hypothetical protein n=1 Tax=Nonomuraea dietziae TaxID=65515 RepID=UPI0033D29A01